MRETADYIRRFALLAAIAVSLVSCAGVPHSSERAVVLESSRFT